MFDSQSDKEVTCLTPSDNLNLNATFDMTKAHTDLLIIFGTDIIYMVKSICIT